MCEPSRPVRLRRIVPMLLSAIVLAAACGGDDGDAEAETEDASPKIGDHWHMAIGFSRCGEELPFQADADGDPDGIHTHADGLIHIHPFSNDAAGANAQLGVFLDVVGADFADSVLTLADGGPLDPAQGCDGGPAELVVARWDSPDDPTPEVTVVEDPSDLTDVPLDSDGGVVAAAVVPEGKVPALPPSAATVGAPGDLPPEATGQGIPVDPTSVFTVAPVLGIHGEPCGVTATESARGGRCYELGAPLLDEQAAFSAEAITDGKGTWGVQIKLTSAAQVALNQATTECLNQSAVCPTGQAAIVSNGTVVVAPRLTSFGMTQLLITTADMDEDQANELAATISQGI
jgi:hypothetical protein